MSPPCHHSHPQHGDRTLCGQTKVSQGHLPDLLTPAFWPHSPKHGRRNGLRPAWSYCASNEERQGRKKKSECLKVQTVLRAFLLAEQSVGVMRSVIFAAPGAPPLSEPLCSYDHLSQMLCSEGKHSVKLTTQRAAL